MNCSSCGFALQPGSGFCESCGTAVAGAMGSVTGEPSNPTGPRGWNSQTGSPSTGPVSGQTSGLRGSMAVPPARGTGPQGSSVPYQGGSSPSVPVYPSGGNDPTMLIGGMGTGGMPPGAMAPGPVPPKSSGGKWFAIGGGAGLLVLLIVGGVLLLTKKKHSNDSVASPDSVASASVDNQASAGTAPPTTVVTAASTIGAAWSEPASWATDRCASQSGDQAVTSLETSLSKVAICLVGTTTGPNAQYVYTGFGIKNNEWSPWLPAKYNSGARQFVATDSGSTPTTYTVSPASLSIVTGSNLVSFEYATNAHAQGKVSRDDLLAELVSLLQTSSSYRASLTDFTNGTFAGSSDCTDASTALDQIQSISDNRQAMSDAASGLAAQAAGTDVQGAAQDFATAMQNSYQQDQILVRWTQNDWSDYLDNNGCDDSRPQPADNYAPDYANYGNAATAAKQRAADEVNTLVAGTGLQGGWTSGNI